MLDTFRPEPVERPVASAGEAAELEWKRHEWDAKTAELRKQMAELEKPVRDKTMAKERSRFPEEYAHLLDVPAEKRTPLERQRFGRRSSRRRP